ncbi:MAG: carboxypeptidase-like regulatory domain-containing protein, partial [Gemmatimonadota bacterium]
MRSGRSAWAWVLAAGMLPLPAQGQSVLVRTFDMDSRQPLQGALVTLDSGDDVMRSVLTDVRGRFLFTDLAPGSYSVRIELIGYTSREQAVTVGPGEARTVELGLESHAIELEGLSVEGEERCTLRPEAGLRVAEVWDEVRKALEAALWTEEQGVYEYRTRRYSRDVEEQTGLVKNQQTRRGRVYLQAPYESLPAEDLI